MKPVYQTRDNPIDGNCLAACLASIFEDDINSYPEVPNDHTWCDVMNEYLLKSHGVYMVSITTNEPHGFLLGHHLIIGDNEISNCGHCVVGFDGKEVHNPSKSNNKITNLRYVFLAKKL